jgi:hypothetical protein
VQSNPHEDSWRREGDIYELSICTQRVLRCRLDQKCLEWIHDADLYDKAIKIKNKADR